MSELLERKGNRSGLKSILMVVGGVSLGFLFYATGPSMTPEDEERPPKTVTTIAPAPMNHRVSITAYGAVIPARRVVMQAQVSGEIRQHHPQVSPGGFVAAGEELFEVDSRLMELSVAESRAAVARANALLKEAQRKREEAQRLAQENVIPTTELLAVESEVEIQSAERHRLEAMLARNEELLRRHSVRAPFNAVVLDEAVEIGQRVDPGMEAVTLVGADEFWVRVALTTEQLKWVRVPRNGQEGARAEIFMEMGDGHVEHRTGRVVRLLSDLERLGRMARVLVSVKDPMGRSGRSVGAPLLIGSYVRVEIDAGELSNVLALPREGMREGDRIWICDQEDRLQIRQVDVKWRHNETVYIGSVLEAGDRIIVSPLRSALPGMELAPQSLAETTALSE